jgi:hypothetical protein
MKGWPDKDLREAVAEDIEEINNIEGSFAS